LPTFGVNKPVEMLIGNNFNKLCEKILLAAGEQSGYEPERKISVKKISEELNLDRTEIRNTFQYLTDLEFISVESIGGPLLYGHISLTKRGLLKLQSIQKK
jgi:hypothetical protein